MSARDGRVATDDLGVTMRLPSVAGRVVSLVPSLTESIAATRAGALVGITDWCTHPPGLDATRVRGTKNPDLAVVRNLLPDLVLANKEENRELDVRRLRDAGVPVWVTVIEDVLGGLEALRRLFVDALGWPVPDWLDQVTRLWDVPAPPADRRVAVPIWRDPWMVVGRDTFADDLLRRLGCTNVFGRAGDVAGRYPHVELGDIDRADVDLVLLPDEPYVFTADDGPEAFTQVPTHLVSGRLLTWCGPSLLEARHLLDAAPPGGRSD